jgi:arsenate reductase
VKKGLKFFKDNGLSYEGIDLTTEGITIEDIKAIHKLSGLPIKKFFNTSGVVYREMGLKDKMKEMSLDEAYELLSSNGMLVKRPLATNGEIVTVGFKEVEYQKYL